MQKDRFKTPEKITTPFDLHLRDVSKRFKVGSEEVYALNAVTVTIKEGEFIAIIGPSGSGKTTLAQIMGGLIRPTEGEVYIAGNSVGRASDKVVSKYRNKYIGFVFQNFSLLPDFTALENVLVPLMVAGYSRTEQQKRAEECLKLVGLEGRMRHNANQLSGGQRQRVAIARALAMQPRIIIADEPTGNLDSAKGHEIITILQQLNKAGISIIMVTHDKELAAKAKRRIHIIDGKIAKDEYAQ